MLLKQYETVLHPHYVSKIEEANSLKVYLSQEVWQFLELCPPLSLELMSLLELAAPLWPKVKKLMAARYLWTHGLKNLEPKILKRAARFIEALEPELSPNEISASLNIRKEDAAHSKFPKSYERLVNKYSLN